MATLLEFALPEDLPSLLRAATMSTSRIVYLSDDRLRTLTLFERLAPLGFDCHRTTHQDLWKSLHGLKPELLILDGSSNTDSTRETITALQNDPVLSSQPWMTTLRSGQGSNTEPHWAQIVNDVCLRTGVKPLRSQLTPRRVRNFGRVLILDPARRLSRQLEVRLRTLGLTVEREFIGLDGFRAAIDWKPDAIISDLVLPKAMGSWVLGRLNDCKRPVPTIFLTPWSSEEFPGLEQTLLDLGASAVLSKGANFSRIVEELAAVMPLPAEVLAEAGIAATVVELAPTQETTRTDIPAPHISVAGRQSTQPQRETMAVEESAVPRPKALMRSRARQQSRSRQADSE